MICAVYSSKDSDSLLLVDKNLWVINGMWQIEEKDNVFYCVSPGSTFPINIYLAGYIDYEFDYNDSLDRFRNGEGQHLVAKEQLQEQMQKQELVQVQAPELCKRKYYGIECSCSKCKG